MKVKEKKYKNPAQDAPAAIVLFHNRSKNEKTIPSAGEEKTTRRHGSNNKKTSRAQPVSYKYQEEENARRRAEMFGEKRGN